MPYSNSWQSGAVCREVVWPGHLGFVVDPSQPVGNTCQVLFLQTALLLVEESK